MGSSIIYVGNSHPIYLPYWQNKRKKKFVDHEEYYHDLLIFSQKDLHMKPSVIINKLENKHGKKVLKDQTIERVLKSYRHILLGRKLKKNSIKLVLENELIESLEKHNVDKRVIKSICKYQLSQEYVPKNTKNARENKVLSQSQQHKEIKNEFYIELCKIGRQQETIMDVSADTRVYIVEKWVKELFEKFPEHISEIEVRKILRAYKLTIKETTYKCDQSVFKNRLGKKLVDCGLNYGMRTLILASDQELSDREERKTHSKKDEEKIKCQKAKDEPKKQLKETSCQKIVTKSEMTEAYFMSIIQLVRKECQRAMQDDQLLHHDWILKELSKEFNIENLKNNMIFIIVTYQFYLNECDENKTKDIEKLLLILKENLEDCGVAKVFHEGILKAEKCYLEEQAIKDAEKYIKQKKETLKEVTEVKEKCTLTEVGEIDETLQSKFYKDMCGLLIKSDSYEVEDIINALYRRYPKNILSEKELIPLIEAYKYMTSLFSDIRDANERAKRIKPILKQRLEAFGVTTEIINRVWENEYGASH